MWISEIDYHFQKLKLLLHNKNKNMDDEKKQLDETPQYLHQQNRILQSYTIYNYYYTLNFSQHKFMDGIFNPKRALKELPASSKNTHSALQIEKTHSAFKNVSNSDDFESPKFHRFRNKQNILFRSDFPKIQAISESSGSERPFKMRIEDFQIGEFMGKGSFGSVRIARHTNTGSFYCIKTMKRQLIQKQLDRFILGLKLQIFADHPNIAKIYGLIVEKKEIHVVMELCIDGDLAQVFNQYKKKHKQSIELLREITNGVRYLHQIRIMHRDLKLQNILMCYELPKISDFDLAAFQSENSAESRRTICGSPVYFSPEMITKCPYTFKADVWSLGIIFYELLCGYFPFKYSDMKDIEAIMEKRMQKPPKSLNELAKNLLYRMLQKKQSKRYSIEEVASHHFLKTSPKHKIL